MSQEPTAAGAPRRRGQTRRKHTVLQVLLASLVVLAMVTALSVVFFYRHLNGNLTVSDIDEELGSDRPEKVVEGPREPLNILVMGDDTRECEGCQIDQETGGGSDTTILFHLSADRTRAYGISIPRDSLVDRPDCGKDDEIPGSEDVMWNAAYSVGGHACTIEQFETLTGVRVDHFVVVDFNGFVGMVDAIGGVPVCIPRDINDPEHDIFIKGGERELMGDDALAYVRVRYTIGDGSDLGRLKRQQNFIASMVNKVVSAGTLADPRKVIGFLDAATESLTVDPGLENVSKIASLGLQFQDIGLDKVQFTTVPNAYYPAESEHRGRVFWVEPDAKRLWKRIAADKPLSPNLLGDVIKAGQVPGVEEPTATAGPDETESPTGSDSPSETASPTESESPTETPRETASPTEAPSSISAEEAEELGLCA